MTPITSYFPPFVENRVRNDANTRERLWNHLGENCPVCLSPLGTGDSENRPIQITTCAHIFHRLCVQQELNCPLCHTPQPFAETFTSHTFPRITEIFETQVPNAPSGVTSVEIANEPNPDSRNRQRLHKGLCAIAVGCCSSAALGAIALTKAPCLAPIIPWPMIGAACHNICCNGPTRPPGYQQMV